MIDHKNKIIFIHIPKCAGSSIEIFFGVKPFDWRTPNYENLTGWCPVRKIHLHHATSKQLLETNLIPEDVWNSYKKFTIVRNPYARSLSDYYWMMKDCKRTGSFESYLTKTGVFKDVLTDSFKKSYRGDHLIPQHKFLEIDGVNEMDFVLKFENLKVEFAEFCKELGILNRGLPHEKKSRKKFEHYSHFYNKKTQLMVRDKYHLDLEKFGYDFEDKNNNLSLYNKITNWIKK